MEAIQVVFEELRKKGTFKKKKYLVLNYLKS